MFKFLYKVFCGFFLGLSVFAPGFSGSVIAIIMGVYQDIVRIASNPFKQLKKNILFCLPLGIGVVISGVLFIISFRFLFETYEKATYLLFVGLITGNLPIIYSEIKKHGFKRKYLIGGIFAFAAALALGIFALRGEQATGADGAVAGLPMMAVSGLAGGATAFIPGMSVSMVLIIAGVYRQLLTIAESLLHLDFTHLIPFGVFGGCALVGLVITSRGIKAVFERVPALANSLVFGFMTGSLIGVLIQSVQINDPGFTWSFGGLMLVIGLAVSMLFVVMGRIMNKG